MMSSATQPRLRTRPYLLRSCKAKEAGDTKKAKPTRSGNKTKKACDKNDDKQPVCSVKRGKRYAYPRLSLNQEQDLSPRIHLVEDSTTVTKLGNEITFHEGQEYELKGEDEDEQAESVATFSGTQRQAWNFLCDEMENDHPEVWELFCEGDNDGEKWQSFVEFAHYMGYAICSMDM